jgi:hypothetical protein
MKTYRESGIVNDVLECIDEAGVTDPIFVGGTENEELASTIRNKIIDAIRFVYSSAYVGMLEPKVEEKEVNESGVYTYLLPEGFLRLCMVTVDGWSHPVFKAIPYDSKEYASLSDSYTTGHPDNPKVAFSFSSSNGIGKRCLELYSIPQRDDKTKVRLFYMPEPKIENGGYSLPEGVYRAVIYYTAGLTLMTHKDTHADTLMNQAIQMIGVK